MKDLKDLPPSEVTADQLCRLIPQYIRSIQGHSGQDRRFSLQDDTEWNITPQDTIHVYHYGRSENLDSILRCGLLPGGPVQEQRRCHSYFSIKNPLDDCSGRPVHYRLQNPIYQTTLVAWPLEEDHNVIYIIEVRRCLELGIKLRQNQTGAVLAEVAIPPECISKVVDLNKNVLFLNDLLDQTAPGDRKANQDLGAPITKAAIYIQLKDGMKEWPKEIAENDAAAQERKFFFFL